MRSLKEEMRPPTPKTKPVQLVDPVPDRLGKKKDLEVPPVETIQLIRPPVEAEEKYSPPELCLASMEEPLLVEVRDQLNLAPPRRKNIEEVKVLELQWNIPSYQYCDIQSRSIHRHEPPQLSIIEEGEVTVPIITHQADLFDQVKMLRPSFIRFRI